MASLKLVPSLTPFGVGMGLKSRHIVIIHIFHLGFHVGVIPVSGLDLFLPCAIQNLTFARSKEALDWVDPAVNDAIRL